MKEVIFVRIKATLVTYGDMKGLQYTFEDVRDVITSKLSDGYTYCGFVPVVLRGTGEMDEIDLIFEREVEKN